MPEHNLFQDVKDDIVAEHLRRREKMRPVTPTGPRRNEVILALYKRLGVNLKDLQA